MSIFLPQPYPLFIVRCYERGEDPWAERVIGWLRLEDEDSGIKRGGSTEELWPVCVAHEPIDPDAAGEQLPVIFPEAAFDNLPADTTGWFRYGERGDLPALLSAAKTWSASTITEPA